MKIKISQDFLLHPSAIFLGIVVGIVIGLTSQRLPSHLAAWGTIYLSLLQMCILPIVITAVTSSLGHLCHMKTARVYLERLLWVFILGMFFVIRWKIYSSIILYT